jgi:hypothetical protein
MIVAKPTNRQFKDSFQVWVFQRQEIATIWEDFKQNPESSFKQVAGCERNSLICQTVVFSSPLSATASNLEVVILNRVGSVLSGGTILKSDHFPGGVSQLSVFILLGCHKQGLPLTIPGAPNFRKVDGDLPIFGVGNPTLAGIKSVLREVGSDARIVWTSLREGQLVLTFWLNYFLEPGTCLHHR